MRRETCWHCGGCLHDEMSLRRQLGEVAGNVAIARLTGVDENWLRRYATFSQGQIQAELEGTCMPCYLKQVRENDCCDKAAS